MKTPSWMPPQPELPWVEGSLDGDLPPSAVKQWGSEYALAAVKAWVASLEFDTDSSPEAPCWYSSDEAHAWECGWSDGAKAVIDAVRKTEQPSRT